jgi:hypothetical protein
MANYFGCPCLSDPSWGSGQTQPTQPLLPPLPPQENPWYVVGLAEEDDCGFSIQGCTHAYSLGAKDMTAGTLVTGVEDNGTGHSENDLCGASINGATVVCEGDITVECSLYGVALYNSRTCRTYCPSQGDSQFVWDIFDADFALSLSTVLVCDRALA